MEKRIPVSMSLDPRRVVYAAFIEGHCCQYEYEESKTKARELVRQVGKKMKEETIHRVE